MSARPDTLLQLLLHMAPGRRLSVLAYHRILPAHDPLRPGEPTVEEFEQRMSWVKANFTVLPLAEAVRGLREGRLPPRALSITFDDGYADNYELALPILLKLGLPATFFIATGYLDGGCMFNDAVIEAIRQARSKHVDLGDLGLGSHALINDKQKLAAVAGVLDRLKRFHPETRSRVTKQIAQRISARIPSDLMMTSGQVAALHRAGMEVGAHTVTHPILTEVALDHAREEMCTGRERLQEITDATVSLFAYPNGKPARDYTAEHVALARELGFDAAVSSSPGAARRGDDLFQIPRFTPWDQANSRFGLRLACNRISESYARV